MAESTYRAKTTGTRSSRRAARKSASRHSRKSKRTAKKTPPPRKSNHNFLYILIFWPFILVARWTRNMNFLMRWPMRLFGGFALMGVFLGTILGTFYMIRASSYDLDRVSEMPARTIVYDRNGKIELGRLHGDNRYLVTFDQVSPHFRDALICREDVRFYYHFGIDPIGIFRATVQNIKRRRLAQGGSTLTIQLAENTFFNPETNRKKSTLRLLDQKFMEMALAVRIESRYSKKEILQHYMNRIFWGNTIRGIEAASRTYFEKSANQLTLSEAATLAGIIRGPNAFSPFRHPDKAINERNVTLGRMVKYGKITQKEADLAKRAPLKVRPKSRRTVLDTYVMDAVRRELARLLERENIKSGGLKVITTIDATIQRAAELSLNRKLTEIEHKPGYHHQTRKQWQSLPPTRRGAPKYLQGACVVIENHTGGVLAVVGGRSAEESKFNRAFQAERQIGSIFKPFVYLAAVNDGMMTKTWIKDGRIQPGEIKGAQRSWTPHNSDGKFGGYITMENALIHSRNTASVRVGNFAGLDQVLQTAKNVGFIQGFPKTPSSFLGSWEASPWQVASAYTVFPNRGDWYRPYIIKEIRNSDGIKLWPTGHSSAKLVVNAAQPGATWSISRVLEKVINRGTGRTVRNLGFKAPCGGKTGTTDHYKDAWFAGYTSSLTCAVWVGFDRPQKIINRGYGATLAAPVWTDIMKTASQLGYPAKKFSLPVLVPTELCHWSSRRATKGCRRSGSAYIALLAKDMVPAPDDFCPIHHKHKKTKRRGFHWPFSKKRVAPHAVPVE